MVELAPDYRPRARLPNVLKFEVRVDIVQTSVCRLTPPPTAALAETFALVVYRGHNSKRAECHSLTSCPCAAIVSNVVAPPRA